MLVLVADGSRTARALTKECLAQLGHSEVAEVANGDEVLARLGAVQPQLAIIDVNLCGTEAAALISRIRGINAQVPIIISAAAAEKGRGEEAVKAGAAAYVLKPFTARGLAEAISAAVPKPAGTAAAEPCTPNNGQPKSEVPTVQNPLRVVVAEDKLKATLVLQNAAPESITLDNIIARLKEASIPITDAVTARISQLVEMACSGRIPADRQYVIAEGRPPSAGIPAGFHTTIGQDKDEPSGKNARVDLRKPRIATVRAGETIGIFSAEVPPRPGIDVFGKPVPAEKTGPGLALGKNAKLAEDGKTVVAAIDGRLLLTGQTVSVVEVVEIKGDVDYASGNVDSNIDVLISGTVREGFSVKSEQSISIRGAIEAARVEARTHVHVSGGIITRDTGRVVAGGEINAKFCEDANLKAGGNIVISRLVMNSRVWTGGRLVVSRGQVIGGHVFAREGVEVQQLGNDANAHTEIVIGYVSGCSADEASIQEMRETAAMIRTRLGPVMARLADMPAGQREQVERLLGEAARLERLVAEYERHQAEEAQKKVASNSGLTISGRLYPGVTITIGDKRTVIDKQSQGPLNIVRRLVERVDEIVLVDQLSGSVHTLNSRRLEPEEAAAVHSRIKAEPALIAGRC